MPDLAQHLHSEFSSHQDFFFLTGAGVEFPVSDALIVRSSFTRKISNWVSWLHELDNDALFISQDIASVCDLFENVFKVPSVECKTIHPH